MKYNQEVTVGEDSYTITMFSPTKGLAVLTKLMKLVGEPLAQAASGMNEGIESVLPKIMNALVERLDEKQVENLIKEDLMSCVLFQNQPVKPIFDIHFQGKIGQMFKVCVEVVKFNYADFLEGVTAAMGKVAVKESSAQKRSVGRSGG